MSSLSRLIPFDTYQGKLTDIELDTDSSVVFHLCETIRELDISEDEIETLNSFLEWASNVKPKPQINEEEGENGL